MLQQVTIHTLNHRVKIQGYHKTHISLWVKDHEYNGIDFNISHLVSVRMFLWSQQIYLLSTSNGKNKIRSVNHVVMVKSFGRVRYLYG